jgi:DNA-binding beta-propeller fold protein YncE
MKRAHWAIFALVFGATAGVAVAQTPAAAPCPPARGGAGASGGRAPATGNASTLNVAMNADTDLPKDSPLAGLPNPYREDFDWAKMPKGRVWGDTRAIAVDKDGKSIWVLDRCDLTGQGCSKPENKNVNPIMKFDSNGNLVKTFGAGMFAAPHGITVDKNGNIWTADGGPIDGCEAPGAPVGNKLREWSPDGKLLMTISGPQGGKRFTGLNDVVVSPVNGDIYVADGHMQPANDRIMKFDKTGKYLMEWGTPGKEDNQIGIPHGLAMDKEGRIYVADRSDVAVKVYDQNGKLLHVWHQFGEPSGVFVDKHDMLYVADETATIPVRNPKLSPGVRIATLDGKIVANVPYRPGNALEGVTVDDAGNIYGANTNHPRAVRWLKVSKP